jgi:hypothetical protein
MIYPKRFKERQRLTMSECLLMITETKEGLDELISYLSSTKFEGFEKDFVYVSTDILPKLKQLRRRLW